MRNKFRGVMQSPVTPLKADFSPDLATFEKVLDCEPFRVVYCGKVD